MSASAQALEALIPHVSITQAVGAPSADLGDKPFDDLVNAGGWPVTQKIQRIRMIEVFVTDTTVRGIRIQYVINGANVMLLHGQSVGKGNKITFDDSDITLVGVFGGRDREGRIASIGFIRFDARPTASPPVEIFGPYGSESPPSRTFGTYGNVIAFIGTDHNESGLRSLGFVKSDALRSGLI